MVAASRSDETFVALCLLTVTGASLLTQRLGFSDTMGAFAAGVLLSETNFRSQVRIRANLRARCRNWGSTESQRGIRRMYVPHSSSSLSTMLISRAMLTHYTK